MAEAITPVWVVAGQAETGVWCDRCLTSAAVTMPMHVLGRSGLIPVGNVGWCMRCDMQEQDERR